MVKLDRELQICSNRRLPPGTLCPASMALGVSPSAINRKAGLRFQREHSMRQLPARKSSPRPVGRSFCLVYRPTTACSLTPRRRGDPAAPRRKIGAVACGNLPHVPCFSRLLAFTALARVSERKTTQEHDGE